MLKDEEQTTRFTNLGRDLRHFDDYFDCPDHYIFKHITQLLHE